MTASVLHWWHGLLRCGTPQSLVRPYVRLGSARWWLWVCYQSGPASEGPRGRVSCHCIGSDGLGPASIISFPGTGIRCTSSRSARRMSAQWLFWTVTLPCGRNGRHRSATDRLLRDPWSSLWRSLYTRGIATAGLPSMPPWRPASRNLALRRRTVFTNVGVWNLLIASNLGRLLSAPHTIASFVARGTNAAFAGTAHVAVHAGSCQE